MALGSAVSAVKGAAEQVQDAWEQRMQRLHEPATESQRSTPLLADKGPMTLLDLAAGKSVACCGLPDGRIVLMFNANGQWREDEFKKVKRTGGGILARRTSYTYRYAPGKARKVLCAFDSGEWTLLSAEDYNSASVSPNVAKEQEAFEAQLRAMSEEAVKAGTHADLVVAAMRHAYNRAWQDQGYGWF
jgi:hypothetical protein